MGDILLGAEKEGEDEVLASRAYGLVCMCVWGRVYVEKTKMHKSHQRFGMSLRRGLESEEFGQ